MRSRAEPRRPTTDPETDREAEVSVEREGKKRRGREATTTAILDVAQELFSERGYHAVSVREIAERAGVTHALVHQYVGRKADIFRAVLSRNESFIASAAPDNPDLLESSGLMLRQGLAAKGRIQGRLVARSALNGLRYDRTTGRFEATERLVELAVQAATSASPAERAGKDLDPRLVVAAFVSLFIGWVSAESWIRPATGLEDMDDAELIDQLVQLTRGMLKENVPGASHDDAQRDGT